MKKYGFIILAIGVLSLLVEYPFYTFPFLYSLLLVVIAFIAVRGLTLHKTGLGTKGTCTAVFTELEKIEDDIEEREYAVIEFIYTDIAYQIKEDISNIDTPLEVGNKMNVIVNRKNIHQSRVSDLLVYDFRLSFLWLIMFIALGIVGYFIYLQNV